MVNSDKQPIVRTGVKATGMILGIEVNQNYTSSLSRGTGWQEYPFVTVRFLKYEKDSPVFFEEQFFPHLQAIQIRLAPQKNVPIKVLKTSNGSRAIIDVEALGYKRDPTATFYTNVAAFIIFGFVALGGIYALIFLSLRRMIYNSLIVTGIPIDGKLLNPNLSNISSNLERSSLFGDTLTIVYSFSDSSGKEQIIHERLFPTALVQELLEITKAEHPTLPVRFRKHKPSVARIDQDELQYRIEEVRLERRQPQP